MSAAGAMALSGVVFAVAAGVIATIASDTYNRSLASRCRGAAWVLFLAAVLMLAMSPWWAVSS